MGSTRSGNMRLEYRKRLALTGIGFTLPTLAFLSVFNGVPIFSALFVSFTSYDLFTSPTFVGLANYAGLPGNKSFWSAFQVTATFTLVWGPLSWVIGYMVANLVRNPMVGRGFFRTLFYVPTVLSSVGLALCWTLLLQRNGPINSALGISVPWLTDTHSALFGIVGFATWQSLGWFMLVFLAGLLAVPREYYEAALVDGAGAWQMQWYITLPLMRPIFAVVVVQTLIGGLKVFSPMFLMTAGGPDNSTQSVAMLVYQEGLRNFRMGRASAISFIGVGVVLVLTVVYLRAFRVRES